MKDWKKWLANIAFMIILLSLILYYIFHEQDPRVLFRLLQEANGWYWLAGLVLVLLFISGESAILRLLLNRVASTPPKKWHCLLYSFIGFFFSAITPAAGGGQPAQIYYMHKDGLDPGTTSPVLVVVTIGYKLVLIFYGLLAILIRPTVLFGANDIVVWWGGAGFALNLLVISFFLLVIFKPTLVERCLLFLTRTIRRLVRWKRLDQLEEKLQKSIANYKEVTSYIKHNSGLMLVVVLISILQRSILFAITWLVLLSFGITAYSLPMVIMMQAMVSLGTDLLPLPGASGANEAFFLLLFESLCGEHLVIPVMVATRGVSFYSLLLICGILTFIATNIINKAYAKKEYKE